MDSERVTDRIDGSKRQCQTHAEKALGKLLPMAAKFQREFEAAMQSRETGFLQLRVDYDRGNLSSIQLTNVESVRPDDD